MVNHATNPIKNESKTIPFIDFLLPYTKPFLNELEKINISKELIGKLQYNLLMEMSSVAELTLQEELDCFRDNGGTSYQKYINLTKLILVNKYPVLDRTLKTIVNNYLLHIQKILSRFSKDFNLIINRLSVKASKNSVIEDIDTRLGDGHNGESTALVTLTNGTKLIYKPRNIDTSKSYNLFIDWVNKKLNTNLKTITCIGFKNYGWLEFVPYETINSPDELEKYYYNAGILLAVTLILGSKDCHYENIIASGKSPVIIDHETIVQPVIVSQSIRTWDEQHKVPHFSVLESMLVVNQDTGAPIELSGYGIKGNTEAMDLVKEVINANTIDSKRITRFVVRKQVEENIPKYKGVYVFANDYKDFFIKGFSRAYDMFMTSRDELTSNNSPILFFENKEIRYVWRPTYIYFKILRYMRASSFMSSFETYRSKLCKLISKAYQKENTKKFKCILEHEVKELLNGDIPLFTLNSSLCHFKEDKSFNVFELSSIDNIKKRIEALSPVHKDEQIEYINKWLEINSHKSSIKKSKLFSTT